jgi:hypothetical protein
MIPKNFDKFQERYDNAEDPAYKDRDEQIDDFADDDDCGGPNYDLYEEY